MDKLQTLIRDVRVLIRNTHTSLKTGDSATPIQPKVRGKVKEQLQRDDLRIAVETALVELLHQFDGFDMAVNEQKIQILEDSERVLGRLESLIETDSVMNTERVDLPDPPPLLASIVEKQLREEKLLMEEIKAKELQKKKEQISEAQRKPDRGPRSGGRRRPPRGRNKSAPEKPTGGGPPRKTGDSGDRKDLKFQKGQSQNPNQSKRRRKPRRPPSNKPS